MNTATIGIDFGTTNSSIALVNSSGDVELAHFSELGVPTDSYRSLLYLEQVKERGINRLKSWSGPAGVEHYLSAEGNGRLMQSLKSFLSSRSLQTTEIFGRRHTFLSLIARILQDLRQKAEDQFGVRINAAVVGRPVQFVAAENEDDNQYAENRLKEALHAAGYESVDFELEPVAAARYYESTLDHDQLILIGDFGGGTSDFSLLRVGPGIRRRGRTAADLLGNAGIGLAGDAFDAKIVRHLVAPALGAGSEMRSMNKILPVPGWVYTKLERWHYLSFLKGRDVMEMLRGVQGHAMEPDVAELLAAIAGPELAYVNDALERLSLYVGEGKSIDEEAVADCVARVRTADTWALVDAVGKRDLGAAIRILADIYDPRDRGLPLLGALAWSIRQLAKYQAATLGGVSSDEAARKAGVFQPFRARELATKARGFRAREVERWLLVLAETDVALKSSRRPADAILDDMLTRMCGAAARRGAA